MNLLETQYQQTPPTTPLTPRPEPPPTRRRNLWPVTVIVVALALVTTTFLLTRDSGTAAAPTAAPTLNETSTPTTIAPSTVSTTAQTPTSLAPAAPSAPGTLTAVDASGIAARVVPSIVTVQVRSGSGIGGSGSGVIYDTAGHIITNDHVVEAGTSYAVVLADGRVYDAVLLGTDPVTDLAVLKIQTTAVTPIELGSADDVVVGDPAVAVGSPLGLDGGPSLSVGVISAQGREVTTSATRTLFGMLQTDAPITQGSSGGALVDGNGRLIGITTAVGVSSVGVEGIGFATPIEIVTRVVDEIIDTGTASEPFLGITGSTAFAPTDDGGDRPIGVTVQSVEPASAAANGGLESGDILTAVDGTPIKTMDELITQLRRYSAGDRISITTDGNGERSVTLDQRA